MESSRLQQSIYIFYVIAVKRFVLHIIVNEANSANFNNDSHNFYFLYKFQIVVGAHGVYRTSIMHCWICYMNFEFHDKLEQNVIFLTFAIVLVYL